jgi:hypothetical protein
MTDLTNELAAAFEEAGYTVSEASENRDRIRVVVLDPEASGDDLQSITYDVVDEDAVLGFNVTNESGTGDEITTVVSFRHRG